jgi:hypothetical protein
MKSFSNKSLLLKIVQKRAPNLSNIAKSVLKGQAAPTDRKHLCQLINDEFCENGMDENYEPNQYGHELEDLLDYVNRPNISKESTSLH